MSFPTVPNLAPVTVTASRLPLYVGAGGTSQGFVERALRFTFSGAKSGTLSVEGLRAVASIQAFQGRLGVSAQVRIWGLPMSQMNAYSSQIAADVSYSTFNVSIEAGDVGGRMHKVIDGAIWRSYVDLTDSPESAFNITIAPLYLATKTIASQSQGGAQNAEDLIGKICAASGMTLYNYKNEAHAVLRNHVTYGSPIDQIEDIARAANFSLYIEESDVYIWPFGKGRDDIIIENFPNQRVGYPMWWESGIIVETEFDQRLQVGRQIKVFSEIPKAQGIWQISQVNHNLATMLERGPWFSTAVLSPVVPS